MCKTIAQARRRSRGKGIRLTVKGIPMSTAWQDLKDHFRKVAVPSFADVKLDRGEATGVIEFPNIDDAREAVRRLDDSEFRGRGEESVRILVEMEESQKGGRDDRDRNGRDFDRDDDRGRDDYKRDDFPHDDARDRSRSRER